MLDSGLEYKSYEQFKSFEQKKHYIQHHKIDFQKTVFILNFNVND